MRILIFHGYLLHGTGSNVYNARLAEALVRAGHEVHLLCQDRDAADFAWVSATGDWDSGSLVVSGAGAATVYRPAIGGLLPVYVADRYAGVEARPFPQLSDEEIERYIECNAAAVRDVVARARPDIALANHLIMGPVVLARALARTGIPYAVKIHGSALEYTVKPHFERFGGWAAEGLAGAAGILVGSRHTGESLWAAMGDPALPGRTRLGPPGVDVVAFAPRDDPAAGLRALVARLAAEPAVTADAGDVFLRDARAAARALSEVDPERDRVVVFVGKLIASKGVELLLAAWPLVVAAEPAARLVLVGFGAFEPGLRALADALAAGDLDAARALRAEDGRELPELAAYLASAEASPPLDRVVWTGRLDHAELEDLLPAAEALVAPSTFPEAFGMVAAEGAACGALPVVARHSGLAEVSDALAARVPPPAREWLSFAVGDDAVRELADCLIGWLAAPEDVRRQTRAAIVAVTRERWSWDGVARTIIAAAQGRLDELPEP